MTGLGAYAAVLRTPSVGYLLGASIIARANQGVMTLSLLLLVTRHHDYTAAGVVMGCLIGGAMVAGPLLGRLADRIGRRRVLLCFSVLSTSATIALALVPPVLGLMAGLALVCGLTVPPITSAVKSALPALVGPGDRITVLAAEATLQELIFIFGPPVAGLLAAVGGPALALIAGGLVSLAGMIAYVSDPRAEAGRRPPATPDVPGTDAAAGDAAPSGRLPQLLPMVGVGAGLGVGLSVTNIAIVALVSGGNQASTASGIALACTSVGSLIGGFLLGARPSWARSAPVHLTAMAVLPPLFPVAPRWAVLGVLLVAFGMTIAPAMTVFNTQVSLLAPPGRSTEIFGWVGSAVTAGFGMGSVIGGAVVDRASPAAGFLTASAALLLGAAAASAFDRPPFWRRRSGASPTDPRTHPRGRAVREAAPPHR
ncbi:MAG TPA: MFS transporter [Micromonosporaceae bacterium]|nr:MFS transporter [Micromonosporaceae bacterium]